MTPHPATIRGNMLSEKFAALCAAKLSGAANISVLADEFFEDLSAELSHAVNKLTVRSIWGPR